MLSGKNYSVISQPGMGPGSGNSADLQLDNYKELTARRKVRFRQTFFFKLKYGMCFIRWLCLQTPMTPLDGFLAPQSWEI